jgi:hypothetical protein
MLALFSACNILVASNNGLQPISDLQISLFSMALSDAILTKIIPKQNLK